MREAYHPLRPRRTPRQRRRRQPAFDYNGERWRRVSRAFLADNPLCAACAKEGRTVPADVTDHILPARWFPERAWDEANFQPLCTKRPFSCHQRKTAWERRGVALDFRRRRRVSILERMTQERRA